MLQQLQQQQLEFLGLIPISGKILSPDFSFF